MMSDNLVCRTGQAVKLLNDNVRTIEIVVTPPNAAQRALGKPEHSDLDAHNKTLGSGDAVNTKTDNSTYWSITDVFTCKAFPIAQRSWHSDSGLSSPKVST